MPPLYICFSERRKNKHLTHHEWDELSSFFAECIRLFRLMKYMGFLLSIFCQSSHLLLLSLFPHVPLVDYTKMKLLGLNKPCDVLSAICWRGLILRFKALSLNRIKWYNFIVRQTENSIKELAHLYRVLKKSRTNILSGLRKYIES